MLLIKQKRNKREKETSEKEDTSLYSHVVCIVVSELNDSKRMVCREPGFAKYILGKS